MCLQQSCIDMSSIDSLNEEGHGTEALCSSASIMIMHGACMVRVTV